MSVVPHIASTSVGAIVITLAVLSVELAAPAIASIAAFTVTDLIVPVVPVSTPVVALATVPFVPLATAPVIPSVTASVEPVSDDSVMHFVTAAVFLLLYLLSVTPMSDLQLCTIQPENAN